MAESVIKAEGDGIEFREDEKGHHAADEDEGEEKNLVDQSTFGIEVHEDQRYQAGLKSGDDEAEENVDTSDAG